MDRKLRRVQEKVTEEMEKWVGRYYIIDIFYCIHKKISKDEAQQLIDEWAKKRVKQINRSYSSGINNNINNSQNTSISNSNSNASGDEAMETISVVASAEPEVYLKIGKVLGTLFFSSNLFFF